MLKILASFLLLLSSISVLTLLSTSRQSHHISVPSIYFPQIQYQPQRLTLDDIFSSNHSWSATLSAQKTIHITSVGDIMLGRQVTIKNQARGFHHLYASVSAELSAADFTIANLETPIINDCQPHPTNMIFCAPVSHIDPLKASGIDVLSLANNHAYDQLEKGFLQTENLLSLSKLLPLPPNTIRYIDIKNVRLALIGFSFIPGRKYITPSDSDISHLISTASRSADLVIVYPHWGNEYTLTPTSHQVRLAHLMVDSGADLVLGSHPHWVQPVEIYLDKLIVYSQGNFIFDQYWSIPTTLGIIGHYIFYHDRLVDAWFVPVKIDLNGVPHLINSQQSNSVINTIRTKSLFK